MFTVNSYYQHKKSKQQVQITGMHEIKPLDIMLNHGIMPIIEFIDVGKPNKIKWHVLTVEDFEKEYEEM